MLKIRSYKYTSYNFQLIGILKKYKILGNYDIIGKHLGVLQQALGVVQTLKSPGRAEFQLFMNLERQVQENLAASRDSTSVVNQVKKLKYQKIKINYSLYILHFFFAFCPHYCYFCCHDIISLVAVFYFLVKM